jgi:NAD(P)-dependent dehydrogenase (short-subunit alcohol dehydrogenase family)
MSDRVAMVTGASRGIGRATAIEFARIGFAVAVVARSAPALDDTRILIEETGGTAVAIVADVTDREVVARAVDVVEREAGAISLLVNNAGSMRAIGPLWRVDPEDWWSDVLTSLAGAYNCCRYVVPRMIERGDGRIVNLTSYAGTRPAPYQSGYGCAKAALNSLTESLAAELGEHGLSVFGVAAGFTRTEMTDHLTSSEAGRRWLPDSGSGRIVDAEQTARLIAHLASGAADELSGRLLHTLDEVDVLLAGIEEIRRDDLYAPRVRRLPGR